MPAHHRTRQIQLAFQGHSIIHHALRSPGPHSDLTGISRSPFAVRIKDSCHLVREIAVILRYIIVAEGKDGKAVIDQFFRRHIPVRIIRSEVDMDKERQLFSFDRYHCIKRKRKIPSVYPAMCSDPVTRCLSGTEVRDDILLTGKSQLFRCRRQKTILLFLQDLQHLFPAFQFGDSSFHHHFLQIFSLS